MAEQLRVLRRIKANLTKAVQGNSELKGDLKDYFALYLRIGQRKFHDKLNSEAISENFNNTVASRRLFRAFNMDLSKALTFGANNTVHFKYSLNPSGVSGNSDPTEYYDAIDINKRRRGPNLERVKEWLKERGIVEKDSKGRDRKTVSTRSGKRTPLDAFARKVQRAIWRKNANKEYKALRLSEMFADILDVKNATSPFRVAMKGFISKAVIGKTA